MRHLIITFLIALILISGCTTNNNVTDSDTNNSVNEVITNNIVDNNNNINDTNVNEDIIMNNAVDNTSNTNNLNVENIQAKLFSNTYARENYYGTGDDGISRDSSDIIVDLSCLKNNAKVSCSEKELNMKKAVDIALSSVYDDSIPKDTSISEIRYVDIVNPECEAGKICEDTSQYYLWIDGPLDNSDRQCYSQTVIIVDKKTWTIIQSNNPVQRCLINYQ